MLPPIILFTAARAAAKQSMRTDPYFAEFLDIFLQEADEQIEKLDDGLLNLEQDPGNIDILNEIFRAAHTLKGSSATMGFSALRDLTHDAETLLDTLRQADAQSRARAVEALLECTATLKGLVSDVREGRTGESDLSPVRQACRNLAAVTPPSNDSPAPNSNASAGEMPAVVFRVMFCPDCQMPGVRAFMAVRELEQHGDVLWHEPGAEAFEGSVDLTQMTIGIHLPDGTDAEAIASRISGISEISGCEVLRVSEPLSVPSSSPSEAAAASVTRRSTSGPATESIQTVRVAVDHLDSVVNLIGELVVDRTGLSLIQQALSDRFPADESAQGLAAIADHLNRVVTDLHYEIMKIRMLPVGQVFRRFPRMVRDLAHDLNKKVDLVLEGEETGLDRSILEDIVDPITHLLRNCLDHGLEIPEQRCAAGKPETGCVKLSARHEEGHIVLDVEDDGAGIDIARLRHAAVAKGAISPEAAGKLDDREVLGLLFISGVSTAQKVTEVSGRGVGMDIVRTNIEKLHGRIEVESKLGEGTRFRVRLPLTLAIAQSLIVKCRSRLYALPLDSVVSATIQQPESVHAVGGNPCVVVFGQTLPLLRMSSIYGETCESGSTSDTLRVVIVRSRGQQAALAVDQLVGTMDVVVKSLGTFLNGSPGISGAAILGDGNLALILDVPSLLELVRQQCMKLAS